MTDPGETAWLDELEVRFTIGDAHTAQVAGVKFAHTLSGAHSADFALALDEQEHLIERAIVEAGYGVDLAQFAAGHFGAAARDEWARLAGAGSTGALGRA
jgi:hypothetical protein